METIVHKTFRGQTITLDASETIYIDCTFEKCKLIYTGGDSPFVNCNIDSEIMITGTAGKVLQFMQSVGMITQNVPPQRPPAIGERPDSGTLH